MRDMVEYLMAARFGMVALAGTGPVWAENQPSCTGHSSFSFLSMTLHVESCGVLNILRLIEE